MFFPCLLLLFNWGYIWGRTGFGERVCCRGGKKSLWEAGVNGVRMAFFLFCIHGAGISHRAIKCIGMGHGEYLTQLFLGWSFFVFFCLVFVLIIFLPFTLYSLSLLYFCVSCLRVSLAIALRLRSPKRCTVFVLFFSYVLLHWLSCVTTNMELSHTITLVRGRPWGSEVDTHTKLFCVSYPLRSCCEI